MNEPGGDTAYADQGRALWGEAGLLIVLLVCLAPFVWSSGWREDELSQLANASRMLTGEVLYRDYLEIITPLSLWLAAGLFTLVGSSLLAARVLMALSLALAGGLMFRLVRVLGGGRLAATLAALSLPFVVVRPFPVWNHHWITLPLVLGAVWLMASRVARPHSLGWLAAGALAALSLLSTQSDGLVMVVVMGLSACLLGALGVWSGADLRAVLVRLAVGFGAVMLVALGILAGYGALEGAWACTWVWPRTHYQAAGNVNNAMVAHDMGHWLAPMTGGWTGRVPFYARVYHVVLVYALLLTIWVGLLAWAGQVVGRRLGGERLSEQQARWGVLAIATLAFIALACVGRADYGHVTTYMPLALVIAFAAADTLRRTTAPIWGALLAALPSVGLSGLVLTGAILVVDGMRQHPDQWRDWRTPDARLCDTPLIRYIRANTQPGDRLVSLPQGSIAYFFGRPSAGDANVMLPPRHGYTTEADYQVLAQRITERQPALIIVTPDHADERELADHLRFSMDGYEQAAVVAYPSFDGDRPCWIFRRKAVAAP